MTLSNEDLNLWNEFKDKCEKSINFDGRITTGKGKNLLKNIKNSLKFQEDTEYLYDDYLDNDNFLLEKDKTLGIDRKSDRKLNSGKYSIDASLDLHGLTIEQAYNKTKAFFEKSIQNNLRCILLITGKGLHSKDSYSIDTIFEAYKKNICIKNESFNKTIKDSMIDWLKQPFFASRIIKYTDAQKVHGGNGAIYILLKKQ